MQKLRKKVSIANLKGFTLIELLVVIAIIALLLSILMPSLAKVKKIAQSVICRNNIRQMTLGLSLYAQNNNDKTMPFDHSFGKYWFHEIAPYLGDDEYKKTAGDTVSKVMDISYCPTAKVAIPGEWGSATQEWIYTISGSNTTGSYGMNLWMLPGGPAYPSVAGEVDPVGEKNKFFQKLIDTNPGITPAFGDCMWVGGWPRGSDPVPPDVRIGSGNGGMGRFSIDRHGKAVNIGFVDGHVENVPLEKLWTLRWHNNFEPNVNIKIY